MKDRLTERQNEGYEFIRSHMRRERRPPTLREIGEALGIRSTNGVSKLLDVLEEKGYVEREPHAARGLRLVEEERAPLASGGGAPDLPLVSRTPSDQPDELRRRPRSYLAVDPRFLRKADDPRACLLARAGDDGMSSDGIRKGDLLVVEEQRANALDNGDMAAFLVGEELRARRFYYANGTMHLRSADSHYTEETYPPGAAGCHPVGRVLGLFRTF
ncbi:MAG: LexA family transcriptional regulator [Bacteroidetes bacterium QS_9_68_14]|nr:MAG: LexA family transcriptional regulator [Bacteroidetes bacterium QS_9_68_14]